MAWGTVNVQSAGSKGAPNGAEWTQSNLTGVTVNKIYHANGLWVLSTAGNGLYYSEDGKTWTQSNVTSGDFWDVICDEYFWFAGSSENGLYRSKDGRAWEAITHSAARGDKRFIISHQGYWVACGTNTSKTPYLVYQLKSIDVTVSNTWTKAKNSSSESYCGLYSMSPYYLVAAFTSGTNETYGFSYSQQWPSNSNYNYGNSGHTLYGVIVNNGLMFQCWDDCVKMYNTQGTSRGSLTISTARGISCGNGVVMITGPNMKPKYCKPTNPLTTPTWTDCSVAPLGIEKSSYGNGVWIGTGTAGTFIANSNLEWSQTSTIKSNCAMYADGVWVLGGNGTGVYYSEAFTAPKE